MNISADISLEFGIRIGVTVILILALVRAAWFRIGSWNYQRRKAHTNGLRLLVTEDRLARILLKSVITGCLVALIWARLAIADIDQRATLSDGLITIITVSLLGLLWVDWYWGLRMDEHEEKHGSHTLERGESI